MATIHVSVRFEASDDRAGAELVGSLVSPSYQASQDAFANTLRSLVGGFMVGYVEVNGDVVLSDTASTDDPATGVGALTPAAPPPPVEGTADGANVTVSLRQAPGTAAPANLETAPHLALDQLSNFLVSLQETGARGASTPSSPPRSGSTGIGASWWHLVPAVLAAAQLWR